MTDQVMFSTLLAARTYREERLDRFGGSIIQYLPFGETTGTTAYDVPPRGRSTARNGTYSTITLAQAGVGGHTSCYNAGTGYIDAYGAGLVAAFSGAEGTIGGWWKIDAVGTWNDATARRIFTFSADASNRVYLTKQTTQHVLTWTYSAGTATQTVNLTTADPVGWVHLFITWSKPNNRMRAFYNGAQTGTNQTGLEVWVGSLAATTTVYGAASKTPAAVNKGYMAEWLVLNREATPSEIAADYKLP